MRNEINAPVSTEPIFSHPEKESDINNYCPPMKAAASEKVQSAVDEFFIENNIVVEDIDDLLREHMRTPYIMNKNNL